MFKEKSIAIPIFIILIITSFFRLLWLDRVPPAISGDELTYILTVKSVAITGSDLSGKWSLPQALLFQYPGKFPQAELSYFLLYPIVGFTDFSLFTTRITYAILSVLTVLLIYLLTRQLFDKKVALIAGFIAAVNPWLIYVGRTTYEMVPSPFFYILAIWLILKLRGTKILLTFPVFALAFYSYIATKVSFIPVVFISSFYAYINNKKKFAKLYLLTSSLSILMVLFFFLSLSGSQTTRTSELFTPFSEDISWEVNEFRRNSMSPGPVTSLFENKLTDFYRITVSKIINVFSFDYLFLNGDQFISIYKHGLFYYLDLTLLIIGSVLIYLKKRREFLFLGFLIFASLLPQVLYKTRIDIFTPHLALFVPLLIVPIAYGASRVLEVRNKIIPMLFVILYVLSVLNFSHIYFFEFPLTGHFDFASRVLSKYISLSQKEGRKVIVFAKIPEDSFKKYIYYSNNLNVDTVRRVKRALSTGDYSLGDIHFVSCGMIPKSWDRENISIYQSGICEVPESNDSYIKISDMIDNGQIYRIYNDSTCNEHSLKPYITGLKINDFSLESLSEEKFCNAFITK